MLKTLILLALAMPVMADEADDDAVAICEIIMMSEDATDADFLACLTDVYEDEEDGDGPILGDGGDTGGCRWPRCGGGPVDVFGGQGPVDKEKGDDVKR